MLGAPFGTLRSQLREPPPPVQSSRERGPRNVWMANRQWPCKDGCSEACCPHPLVVEACVVSCRQRSMRWSAIAPLALHILASGDAGLGSSCWVRGQRAGEGGEFKAQPPWRPCGHVRHAAIHGSGPGLAGQLAQSPGAGRLFGPYCTSLTQVKQG